MLGKTYSMMFKNYEAELNSLFALKKREHNDISIIWMCLVDP
jgi:hypothetical protein